MDLDRYQKLALSTAMYPSGLLGLLYTTLGLSGEAGEVADKVKKIIRDQDDPYSDLSEEKKNELAKEVGDVLWYVATVSHELGFDLSHIATMNINKLLSRKKRKVIKGSGDNR